MDKKGLQLANTSDVVASAHCDLEAEWVTAIATDEVSTSVLPLPLLVGLAGVGAGAAC